jgi:hypothetical protein
MSQKMGIQMNKKMDKKTNMKTNLKKSAIIAMGLLAINVSAFAAAGGAGGGNGGDNVPPDTGAAWFLGADQKIKTCYEIFPGFPADGPSLEATLRSVFASWKNYTMGEEKEFKPEHQISMDVEFVPCDGTQELAIYLGTDSSNIDTAKNQYVDPIGFAQRSEYDADLKRGRGFVWVKLDNWSADQLHGIFMHEIGHVLGCGHIGGTIMDSGIADMVGTAGRTMKPIEKASMFQIDQERFLSYPYFGVVDVAASFPDGGTDNTKMLQGAFQYFVGRAAIGDLSARFHWDSKTMVVTLTDSLGSTDVQLQILQQFEEYSSGTMAFRTYWHESDGFHGSYAGGAEGFSWLVSATSKNAKSQTAILNVNGMRLIDLNYLDDQGKYQPLFATDYTF